MRIARAFLAALALIAGAGAADAHRALLIGVDAYPGLAPALALAAPGEDVRSLAAALERAGLPRADIRAMTSAGGDAPTRAAVLTALANIAATAQAGEQILVYFSGHGTQAPGGREADGLDELYLMADAAGWDGGQGRVPGAIADRELADALDRIRSTGADVWFVADTCHAGGVFRGAEGRTKAIPPALLGIPVVRRAIRPVARPRKADRAGRLAAFYAAGPDGLAVERRLPLGAPDAAVRSQFSFALTRALDAGRLRSLRDLAIAANAADETLGGTAPQPLFEGALDQPVLGLAGRATRRWPVARAGEGLSVAAGPEEGFAAGRTATLRDGSGKAVGTARILSAALGRSRLAPSGPLPFGMLEAEPDGAPIDGRAAFLAALPAMAGQGAARAIQASATLWRPGARPRCPVLDPATTEGYRPIELMAPDTLGQCDVIVASFRNGGDRPVDLSPFYLDAGGRLMALSFLDGGTARVMPGDHRRVAVRLLDRDPAGRPLPVGGERLAVVVLPAGDGPPGDLRGLAAPTLRGESAAVDPAGGGALVYRWTVAAGRR